MNVAAYACLVQEMDKATTCIIAVVEQALKMAPKGVNARIIMEFLNTQVGDDEYQGFMDMFGWNDTDMGHAKFKDWVLQHCDWLKEEETHSGRICTKEPWIGNDEEVLQKVIQLYMMIYPGLSYLLQNINISEAISILGPDYLTNFSAWVDSTLLELGWKVSQHNIILIKL